MATPGLGTRRYTNDQAELRQIWVLLPSYVETGCHYVTFDSLELTETYVYLPTNATVRGVGCGPPHLALGGDSPEPQHPVPAQTQFSVGIEPGTC